MCVFLPFLIVHILASMCMCLPLSPSIFVFITFNFPSFKFFFFGKKRCNSIAITSEKRGADIYTYIRQLWVTYVVLYFLNSLYLTIQMFRALYPGSNEQSHVQMSTLVLSRVGPFFSSLSFAFFG